MTSWITRTSPFRIDRAERRLAIAPAPIVALAAALIVAPAAAQTDNRPLSPAQIALFETPHLDNIGRPETLEYQFRREGAGAFSDSIAERIEKIHPDGSKYVGFDFLSGEHRVPFPAVDHFRGNPLLMLFLERDVREMRDDTGIAAAYWRNRIREAFVDRARMAETEISLHGKSLPARQVVLRPFGDDPRLKSLPGIRDKTYTFVLSEAVPGMIAELATEEPANPATGEAGSAERITFAGEKPIGDQK